MPVLRLSQKKNSYRNKYHQQAIKKNNTACVARKMKNTFFSGSCHSLLRKNDKYF